MADAIIGAANELDASKMDLIVNFAQRELQAQNILTRFVRDVSNFAEQGLKTVEFPKYTSFTAVNRAEGTAGDATVISTSNDVLSLDQCPYLAWIIDSKSKVQSRTDAEFEAISRAMSAMGRFVDAAIIAELVAVAGYSAGGGAIDRDKILAMQEALLLQNADEKKLSLVVSVSERTNMLKVPQFEEAQIYGSATIPSGVIGSVYGMPVITHNLLASGQAFMFDSDGIAYGSQSGPSVSDQGANEYGANARRRALDMLFGVKGMQLGVDPAGAGLLATQSPLVAKLEA